MKQSNRILAYSALALLVMLAAFGAIAFDTSNVAYAQGTGTVPAAPTLTAVASTRVRTQSTSRGTPSTTLKATNSGRGIAKTNGNASMAARLIR